MFAHRFPLALLTNLGLSVTFAGLAQAQEPVAPSDAAPAATEPAAPPAVEAQPAPVVDDAAPPTAPADKPKPSPYSLPWQLRPATPGNAVRLDSSYAFYKNPATDKSGSAFATSILGSYKVIPDLAVIARVGFVSNEPPSGGVTKSATSFLNPVLGGLYGIKLSPDFKLALFLAVALPLGSGGGKTPDTDKAAANGVGIWTRSAFDNAMFVPDYFTVFPGFDIAYVKGGLTLQGEATVLKLTKARGPDAEDDSRVNLTAGFHAGYFILPMLSLGAEIRHQRWLSTPTPVKTNAAARDTSTVAIGPRFHFKFSKSVAFHPGVSFTMPLDDPMKKSDYKIVQLDLPVTF